MEYEREVRIIDIQELKSYIIENDKLNEILSSLSCHHIQDKGDYFTCGRPNGDNPHSIVVYKNNLAVNQYTGECIKGDILSLVMGIKNIDFISALKWVHKILGLEWDKKQKNNTTKQKFNPLEIFTSKLKSKHKCVVNDIEIYDDSIINEYVDCLYIDWVKEGITEQARKDFQIGYSFDKKRIIIPEHWWCGNGEIIGVSSRTTNPLYKEFNIPKYYPIIPYKKSRNLYGLYQNYNEIQNKKIVVVAESQKSVLKRYSLLDGTVVACESHSLSEEQISILIGLNVEVCICFDKDVPLQEVLETCEKFYNIRKVSFMYDFYDLLDDKESPMDKKNKIYNYLFQHRKTYDEKWHNIMLKNKNKKRNCK